MNYAIPNVQTHVAKTAELPDEPKETDIDRPDLPVPHLWQQAVVAINRKTGQKVIVAKIDYGTNLFRAFYPDQHDKDGKLGRFGPRTEWFSCAPTSDWEPEVTLSPAELQRQATAEELRLAIAAMSEDDAALVHALCDDADPAKNYAKMKMLMKAKLIGASPEVVAEVAKTKGKSK